MIRLSVAACSLVLLCAIGVASYAQRGRGAALGVAQQATKPESVAVEGTLKLIETGPCEQSTGRAGIGTHLVLQTEEGETVNLHLGPSAVVDRYIEGLQAGMNVKATAFTTPRLPAGHYVAEQIQFEDKSITLRSESLRPIWAGRGIDAQRGTRPHHPYGRGGGNSSAGPWWADEDWSGPPPGRGFGRHFGGPGAGYGRGPANAR